MEKPTTEQFDTIVIGAGHNGLICAAYLAKAGQRVLVLEASEQMGGLAQTREFHPGFKASIAHTTTHVSNKVVHELKLMSHGLSVGSALSTIALDEAGEHVTIAGAAVTGVGANDVSTFKEYHAKMRRYADLLRFVWHKTIPRIGNNSLPDILTFASIGLKLRMLGKEDMGEFLRVFSLPARDLMDENFENELLKAALSWDALIGSKMAPRSPNHSILGLLYRMGGAQGGDHTLPSGGIEGLITALAQSAKAAGAKIRTGAAVRRVLIDGSEDGLATTGVELANGDLIPAKRVVSSADPKTTFLSLVGAQHLEIEFTNRIIRLRSDGFVAKLHLALDGLPKFSGIKHSDGRMIIAPTLDSLEFAFDDAKYGEVSQNLQMELLIPSLQNPTMAPEGKHVLSAHMMYVPYDLKGGWTDPARDALCSQAIDTIARYAPSIREQVLHAEVLTPWDIEQTCNATGGHWHHTELALDQMLMMRPTYEAAQYATPIPGLFLCGAGSHPGGGLMGGPGHNAAREILK